MRLILAVFLVFPSLVTLGQVKKEINLSTNIEKATEPIESGVPIELVIRNKAVPNSYEVSINRVFQQPATLPSPKAVEARVNACADLPAVLTNIKKETDESKLPLLRMQAERLITEIQGACPAVVEFEQLNQVMDQRILLSPLKKGERIEITIKRLAPSAKTWSITFTTGEKGVWRASYGFAFIPQTLSKEKRYFLNASNQVTQEQQDQTKWDYAPTVFFNWFPAAKQADNFIWGLSGGLGLNFNASPIVFLGLSVTYNYNISVNLGLAAHQLKFLKGRYTEGQTINENNFDEEDGLHQKLFRINPCISLSFRFEQKNLRQSQVFLCPYRLFTVQDSVILPLIRASARCNFTVQTNQL
jgi:hypothetical protein